VGGGAAVDGDDMIDVDADAGKPDVDGREGKQGAEAGMCDKNNTLVQLGGRPRTNLFSCCRNRAMSRRHR
jgi:hypothetical protein